MSKVLKVLGRLLRQSGLNKNCSSSCISVFKADIAPYSARISSNFGTGMLQHETHGCWVTDLRCRGFQLHASLQSGKTVEELQQKIDDMNDKFVEARDEIDYAKEDAETVYFNEAYDAAKDAVEEVLAGYSDVLGQLSEAEKGKLQRSMGLKIEQLKAELSLLDDLHA